MSKNNESPWQQQQQFIEKMRRERPEVLKNEKPFLDDEVLPKIGITGLPEDRPTGYIKLLPQDFIVEEVQNDETLSSIKPNDKVPEPIPKHRTLYADLIKVGISTLDAVDRLAYLLSVPETRVGFAGIKDPLAFTSQRISLPKVKFENLPDLSAESFILTNAFYGKGKILKGQLLGNRFSILVRTEKSVDRDWLKDRLLAMKENGFLNYYHSQRFGSERLSTHILGKLILQDRYKEMVKYYLTNISEYDSEISKIIRRQVCANYGQWQEMRRLMRQLPFTFKNELKIINYFISRGENYLGALHAIQDITKLSVYAYASLLFNRYLSQAAKENKPLPATLPLLIDNNRENIKIYEHWLAEDEITNLKKALEPLSFITLGQRFAPTKIFAVNVKALVLDRAVIIHFYLPKAAYATTFLMNIFRLWQGYPLPNWIDKQEYDSLKLLGLGSIEPAKERLKKFVYMPFDKIQQINIA